MKNVIKCVIVLPLFVIVNTIFFNFNQLEATEIPINGTANDEVVSLDLAKSMVIRLFQRAPSWNNDIKIALKEIVNEDLWNNYRYQLFKITSKYGKGRIYMINKDNVLLLGHVNSLVLYDVDKDGHLDILISQETGSGGLVSQLIYMNVFNNIANKKNIETFPGESYKSVLFGRREDEMLLKIINNRLFLYNGYLVYDDNYATEINNISDDKLIGEIVFDLKPILAARIIFQDNIEESQRKKFRFFPLPPTTSSSDTTTENDNIPDISSTKDKISVVPEQLQKPKTDSDILITGNAESPSLNFINKYALVAVLLVLIIPVIMISRKPQK